MFELHQSLMPKIDVYIYFFMWHDWHVEDDSLWEVFSGGVIIWIFSSVRNESTNAVFIDLI